jgi:uncharacterized membrane protein
MNIMSNLKKNLQSWALWTGVVALIVFVTANAIGIDISDPATMLMALLLPVLVGFGIINDPATRDKLFANGEQYWYQSKVLWVAIAALITYCVRLFFNLDVGPFVSGLMDVLLPILMTLGIIKSPTSATTI